MTLADWVNPGIERSILQIKDLTAKLEAAEAEVERLKAQPTAAQERAAIVAWLSSGKIPCGAPHQGALREWIIQRVERGEHWPTEGEP